MQTREQKRIIPVVRQRDIQSIKIKRVQSPMPRANIGKLAQEVALRASLQKIKPYPVKSQVKIVQHNTRFVKYANKMSAQSDNIVKDSNYNKLMNIKGSGTGQILVMIACGPSANEVNFLPLKNVKNIRLMVINKPIEYIWPTDYWAFCDHSQFKRNEQAFDSYDGMLINSTGVRGRRPNQVLIKAIQGKGFNRDISNTGYFIGRSSVYANMQTALFMNFDKIFIFGIDMCAVDGKTHHYGNGFNPDVAPDLRIQRFAHEAEHYLNASNILPEDIRKKFYFCSSYNKFSFLDKFNKWDHKDAVKKILEMVK